MMVQFKILQLTPARLALAALTSAAALALACNKPPESPAQPEATPSEAPAVAATAVKRKNFHDMDHGERIAYMKDTVVPEMKALWVEAGLNVEHFGCKTCHGAGAENGSFKMPSDELPKLDATDGFADEKKEHPAVMQFMMEKVVLRMAAFVDEEPYDPATHQGFGCFECHTKATAP